MPQSDFYFFPTSRCGVLVFRFAPAASASASARPAATYHLALITAQLITPLVTATSSHSSHHCTTYHISLITPQLITAPLLRPHSSHHNSSQLHFSHLTHHRWAAAGCRAACAVHRAVWRSCCAHGHRWAAAGCRVAGAVHRAVWRSCCVVVAAGPRLAAVSQDTECCGRAAARVVAAGLRLAVVWQSFQAELLRAWVAAGPRLAVVWQAQCTEPPGRAAAGVVGGGPRLAPVWQAQWLAVVWQAQCTEPFGGADARVVAAGPRLAAVWQVQYCSTQSLLAELLPLRHTPSFAHTTFSHTIFHTPSFTHRHRPSFTHHLSHTTLSHAIFDTPSFTHNFVAHHLSPHHLCPHHLSSTSFVFPFFPVPGTTLLAHYWKKLTCGVIRSFYTLYMPGFIFTFGAYLTKVLIVALFVGTSSH